MQAAFPELATDLRLPHPPVSHPFFSSVLRISSGKQQRCASGTFIQHVSPE